MCPAGASGSRRLHQKDTLPAATLETAATVGGDSARCAEHAAADRTAGGAGEGAGEPRFVGAALAVRQAGRALRLAAAFLAPLALLLVPCLVAGGGNQ